MIIDLTERLQSAPKEACYLCGLRLADGRYSVELRQEGQEPFVFETCETPEALYAAYNRILDIIKRLPAQIREVQHD